MENISKSEKAEKYFSTMTQSTITRYFKKESQSMTQLANTHYIKEEIDIDWDETDNCYGEAFDEEQRKRTAKEVLNKLPEPALQKYNNRDFLNCPIREKNFKNKKKLYMHRQYCGKERVLQCAHCSLKTKYKSALIRHLSTVHRDEKADMHQNKNNDARKHYRICEKCNEISESLCPIECERCFSKLLYQCAKCLKVFKTLSLVDYHWYTRCGVKGYFNCTQCDFKSVWRSKVAQHMKLMHKSPDLFQKLENIQLISLSKDNAIEGTTTYKCPKCSKTMINAVKLAQHIRVCGGLDGAKSISMSRKNDRVVNNVDPKLTINKCSSCGKQFGHIYSLNDHTRYCKKKMKYMIKVTTNEDVEDVETDHTLKSLISADKRYARYLKMIVRYCSKCKEDSAVEEINRGIGRKMFCHKCETCLVFKCKKCLKQFTAYKVMKHHLDTICNPKEGFQCTKCIFIIKSYVPKSIKLHYFTRHKTPNYDCKQCGSRFRRSAQLRIHLLRCGGEPIFQCEHCLFRSTRKLYLKRHIFRQHMEPFVSGGDIAIKPAKLYLRGAISRLTAHCLKCNNEQRLSNCLKTCGKCKTELYFGCKTCQKNCNADDKNACNHVKSYLKATKFECKRCSRGFRLKKYLQSHESHCGTKVTFLCRFCKYITNRKASIKMHEKVMHLNEA